MTDWLTDWLIDWLTGLIDFLFVGDRAAATQEPDRQEVSAARWKPKHAGGGQVQQVCAYSKVMFYPGSQQGLWLHIFKIQSN